MHISTSETKTEYYFFKDLERIVFMVLGVVKTMRFSVKNNLLKRYFNIKNGIKSGNSIEDFFHYSGSCKRCISV